MCIDAEGLTALGTLAAVFVALLVAFIPSINNWVSKPKFKIEFENEIPFCRLATLKKDPNKVKHYWVRVKVSNRGRSVAKRCKGKLIRIRDAKTMEERKDFDAVILRWVTGQGELMDLARKEDEFLNVLFTQETDPSHFTIDAFDKEPRAINLVPERKDYIFDIVFLGDNIDPITKYFCFKNAKEYNKIELFECNDKGKALNQLSPSKASKSPEEGTLTSSTTMTTTTS